MAGQHMSFKDAGTVLCLSASAVSHQVKNLEADLGLALFERKTRSLEFTEAGQAYFAFLHRMFARLETETHQLRAQYGRSMIRLSLPPFFASQLVLQKLNRFHQMAPDTDIRVSTQPSVMKVHPAEADLSVLLGPDQWPGLVTYSLFERRIVVAAAPDLLSNTNVNSVEDLHGQTLIVHENRPDSWANWARAAGVEVPKAGNVLRFDSMSTLVQAAAQGLGFAIISWPLSTSWFQSGALQRVFDQEWDTGEHFYLAHRPEDGEREPVAKLVEWVIAEFQSDT